MQIICYVALTYQMHQSIETNEEYEWGLIM